MYLIDCYFLQAIAFTISEWIYGSFSCPLLHFLHIQTMSVSIFTICSLAVMRFLALRIPFKIEKIFIATTEKHAGMSIIFLVWFLASMLSVPNAVFYRTVDHNLTSISAKSDTGKLNFKQLYLKCFRIL